MEAGGGSWDVKLGWLDPWLNVPEHGWQTARDISGPSQPLNSENFWTPTPSPVLSHGLWRLRF